MNLFIAVSLNAFVYAYMYVCVYVAVDFGSFRLIVGNFFFWY